MLLEDRVAIVTAGGGPGMGRAISLALAKEGASVVVAEIDPGRARETAKAVAGEGQVVEPFREVRPDEIASAVLYLVGPASDRVTGTVMHVNGGSYLPA